jgi:hypothetical protein
MYLEFQNSLLKVRTWLQGFWIRVMTSSFFFFGLSIGLSKSLGVEFLKVELGICMPQNF